MTDGEYHEGRDSLNKIFFNIIDYVAELSKYNLYFYSALTPEKVSGSISMLFGLKILLN